MKKKIIFVVVTMFVMSTFVSAFAPAIGGDSLFDLASPYGLSYGSSTVGGGIPYIGPTSLIANPALAAREQRIGLNASYTALIGTGDNSSFGSAFQTGIMIPFDWAVASGLVNASFVDKTIGYGNSVNIKAGLSKEITDHLNVGVGANFGWSFGNYSDWLMSGSLGFVYDIPQLAFIEDFRFGASVLNLGKNYRVHDETAFLEQFPTFATIKAGAAGIFFSNDTLKVGVSADVTTPCFTNMILDMGAQLMVKDMLTISVTEKVNFWELSNDIQNLIPAVGIFFKFTFNVKNSDYLSSRDWSQNEMTAGVAYRNLYTDVHAISGGIDILLGQKDETGPDIKLWDDED